MAQTRLIRVNPANPSWIKGYTESRNGRKRDLNKYKKAFKHQTNKNPQVDSIANVIPGLSHALNSQKGISYNLVWFLIVFFSCSTCGYQIYNRFSTYLARPVDTKVTLIRNSSVKFPSVTLCPGLGNYIPLIDLRSQKADEKNLTNFCQVDFVNLLNDTVNVSILWDLMSINGTIETSYLYSRSSLLRSNNDLPFIYPEKLIKTVYGTCFTYRFENLIRFQRDDFVISFRFYKQLQLCTESIVAMIVLHNDDEIMNYKVTTEYKKLKPRTNLLYSLSAKRFKVLNQLHKPCGTIKAVSECENKCIEKTLKKIVKCRLPFISDWELPMCISEKDVNDTVNKVLNLAATFNYFKNCTCPKKCDEILYTDRIKLIEDMDKSKFGLYFDDNVIQDIEEYYSYTFIPFVCDIGGNLGLFLGLSIPAMFELGESIVLYFVKKIISN